ncbi:MAG: HAD-IA family hydrolase [Holosporaceae bacterium]|jgi:HAD superfamily hydrolase (TIGR01450 family)|nr:HAD-IA family hydrolase [Holosporaceae bacterium]
MEIKDSVLSIADNYEAFFVDIYGVLYDGVGLYNQTLATMEELKAMGKKIVLLSNLTLIAEEAKIKYARMNMVQETHYDEIVTSGEFLRRVIENRPNEFTKLIGDKIETYKCLFMANTALFEETDIRETDAVDADFIYVGLPRASYGAVRIDDVYDSSTGRKIDIDQVVNSDWHNVQDSRGRKGLLEYAIQLEACLHMNKTLLISNPDIFSRSSQKSSDQPAAIITQGGIGAYYEKLGGKVAYFGKPYTGIFQYARKLINCDGAILMVGDSPWTDIIGANDCGIDSALTLETGMPDEFFKEMNGSISIDEKCRLLLEEITPRMTKVAGDARPKYFLKRFASKRR